MGVPDVPYEGPPDGSPEALAGIVSDSDLAATAVEGLESDVEQAPWITDLKTFGVSHQDAITKVIGAFQSPSQEGLDAANEALGVASKNSSIIFEKEYFRGMALGDEPDPTPLESAVTVVVQATEGLDRQLKIMFPLRIEQDKLSKEELRKKIDEAKGDNRDKALEPLASFSKDYAALCTELQEALKTPRIATAIAKQKAEQNAQASSQEPRDWRKEIADLSLASGALFVATALANILARPKTKPKQ